MQAGFGDRAAGPTRLNTRARPFVPSWETPAAGLPSKAAGSSAAVPAEEALGCLFERAAAKVPLLRRSPTDAEAKEEVQASDEEVEDDEEDEDLKEDRRWDNAPNRRICPLDVRFSQFRARSAFRDGMLLSESMEQIRVVPLKGEGSAAAPPLPPPLLGPDGKQQGGGGAQDQEYDVLLVAPFPPIEVLPWRCKLRLSSGRPMLDKTGEHEVYDSEDRWFTLDNRRLFCLQKAAVAQWPLRAVVDVVELPGGPLIRQRQLKKFRTFDRGASILIGPKAAEEPPARWSWREALGLEAEDLGLPEDFDPEQSSAQPRRRRGTNHARRPDEERQGRLDRQHSSQLGGKETAGTSGMLADSGAAQGVRRRATIAMMQDQNPRGGDSFVAVRCSSSAISFSAPWSRSFKTLSRLRAEALRALERTCMNVKTPARRRVQGARGHSSSR
eukprot:CAMPEP_0177375774 /NCGR_PEP_ID=MMETSP0368-20130122/44876_1 /TAXON_ID=447022 ORGANISM="Scrippsiella hangoei-like, Strain SHHI-4" /NCGR_SAMPLE_ID=MMETSP0368 /ASSEMBLY_ACC=CAM_ASM_000363 /LENGTH=441 /DNA_ID=CAMNT_0018839471 /DNA_START=43 /DNA_END=1367 /DNA_ORIENTATION=+